MRFIELGDALFARPWCDATEVGVLLHLSAAIVNGDLSFTRLARMSDDEARLVLTRMKGIGTWSADVYLLMAMRRADIWPAGDLALAVAMKELKGLARSPGPEELERLAEQWRPTAPSPRECCGSITSGEKLAQDHKSLQDSQDRSCKSCKIFVILLRQLL